MTSVTCVTTRYLPNLRHLARLHEADVAVLLDLAPLPDRNANSFVNRNRIFDRTRDRAAWLTVPIARGRGQRISDVLIAPGEPQWSEEHIDKICALFPAHERTAPGFVAALEEQLANHRPNLLTLNSAINSFLLSKLKHVKHLTLESELVAQHSSAHRLEISRAVGATTYVAGEVEWKSMEATGFLELFARFGIEVVKSPNPAEVGFDHSMVSDLSCVDAMCRYGVDETSEVLAKMIEIGRVQTKSRTASSLCVAQRIMSAS